MQTLSFGYLNPDSGDPGSLFFPALNADIVQLNAHNHDGVNSAIISSFNVQGAQVVGAAVNWVLFAAGIYRQIITCPANFTYDNTDKEFRLNATGHLIYPTVEKISSTTFYVYLNDNTQDVLVNFR